MYRFVLGLVACVAIGACTEDSTSPANHQIPIEQLHNLGTVIVDVDVQSGTVKMHPMGASMEAPPGVSGRFFGSIAQIQYLFSGQPQGFASTDSVEFNLRGGVSNLMDFAIGTNSSHTWPFFPQDTIGVYVYYTFLPYNIMYAPDGNAIPTTCPALSCTVAVDSADGVYPFTGGVPQPYLYFKTILEGGGTGAQAPGNFETSQLGLFPGAINYTRPFSFRTRAPLGTLVRTFSFGISMMAPWVEPNESRWPVHYIADSLPNRINLQRLRSEPDWRVLGAGGGAASIQAPGCVAGTNSCQLRIVSTVATAQPETLMYYRSDSLRASQDGYIAATMTMPVTSDSASIFLGLMDPNKLVQLGISATVSGFTDSVGAFIPGATVSTSLAGSSWRVSKFGNATAALYSPASSSVPLLTIPYASLPTAPTRPDPSVNYDRFFFFGNWTRPGAASSATSLWSNVNYEIGATGP
ncbi:MAG: hypothetical protein ABIP73_10375 [Gemmatimonadaceae bacterium]